MKRKIKTVGLVGKYQHDAVSGPITRLGQFLQQRGLNIVLDAQTATLIREPLGPNVALAEMGRTIDLAVVIGGDGTLLHVARTLAPHGVPIIGVNQGRLGFLTDIPAERMESEIGRMLDGDYKSEQRLLLHAEVVRGGKVLRAEHAFNDVTVTKGDLARMIEFETYIGDAFVHSARGDGMIVASPTGSTAYALSAGGPILHPTLPAIVLVPISPHTLSNRPIVVSSDSVVELVLVGPAGGQAHVTFDGQLNYVLNDSDRVRVRRAEHMVELLHPASRSHYDVLRAKLHWGTKY